MTAVEEEVDDRFAGIDIDSLLNRADHRPLSYGRKKALYEAPEFIQRLNGEETVMEGQSLCIECKVRGFPVPTLRWFKDDEEILDHPRIHVESNGKGGYCLLIDNAHKGDEAAYRCRAENVEGACSSFFFLSVKSKPKSQKKKDQKSSANRRTVSFPPMFATIVEKVEEEEKQGKELQQLPPSPMTDFYYALTLKGRQSWPTFLGDWAFVNGGHSHRRRNSTGSINTDSSEGSSDDEVFDDEDDDSPLYDLADESTDEPPAKKPLFYLNEDMDISGSDASPTDSIFVFNSNMFQTKLDPEEATGDKDFQNTQNNNDPVTRGKEVLDNTGHVSEFNQSELDNILIASKAEISKCYEGKLEEKNSTTNLKERQKEKDMCIKNTTSLSQEVKSNVGDIYETDTLSSTDLATRRTSDPSRILIVDKVPEGERLDKGTESRFTMSGTTGIKGPFSCGRGDTTPPIVVELWDENGASENIPTNQLMSGHSSTNESKDSVGHLEYSRFDREPTPYFKSDDDPHGIPHTDGKSRNINASIVQGLTLTIAGKSSSVEAAKEFHREPTPFYDSKVNTGSSELSADVHAATGTVVRYQRELTPFYKDATLKSSNLPIESGLLSTSSSLVVPSLSECLRDIRESTPYYNETDPYEYVHHPDHHFSERTSALIRRSSLDNKVDLPEEASLLSLQSQGLLSLSDVTQHTSRPKRQRIQQHAPTLSVPTDSKERHAVKPCLKTTDHKDQSVSCRSRSPETLASPKQTTLEIKHLSPLSTSPAVKSPVLKYNSQPQNVGTQITTGPTLESINYSSKSKHTPKKENITTKTYENDNKDTKKLTNDPLEEHRNSASSKAISASLITEQANDTRYPEKQYYESQTSHLITQQPSCADQQTTYSLQQSNIKTPIQLRPDLRKTPEYEKAATNSTERLSYASKTHVYQHSEEKSISKTEELQQKMFQMEKTNIPLDQTRDTHISTQQITPLPARAKSILPSTSQTGILPKEISSSSMAQCRSPAPEQISRGPATESCAEVKPETTDNDALPPKDSVLQHSSKTSAPASVVRRARRASPELSDNNVNQKKIETKVSQQDLTPRQLLVSAKDIYPVEIFDDEPANEAAGTLKPANQTREKQSEETAGQKKKKSGTSRFSSSISTFFKSKRKEDDQKDNRITKEKPKRKIFAKSGKKNISNTPQSVPSEEPQDQPARPSCVSRQTLAKCSPFGSYTVEGFCFLFVLTLFCLHIDMSIEKFVCYVLAAFYTFCVMRILGVIA